MAYWLIKSEPFKYSFSQFEKDKKAQWDGVRNFEARNHLRTMKKGDLALFYHSNEGKEIVGIARVEREAYADPTADEGDWSVVDFAPVTKLTQPVTLAAVRLNPKLENMALVKRSRISVVPVTPSEWKAVLLAGKTKI